MPSLTETFGLVYAEAMSQGLPVIYTRGQGFDGQFKEGEVGYSVNSSDIHEIVKKIISIIENYSEISKRCVKLVDKFNWNEITNNYNEIYKDILSRKGISIN
jgi:glycosyltransferase involved in cell wall biosynthesis